MLPLAATGLLVSGLVQAEESLESLRQDIEQLKRRIDRQQPAAATNESFNPDISLILSATYGAFKNDPENYFIPGISLGEETDPGKRGVALGESELVVSSNIDDKFFGRFTAAITPENEIEVEEAYIQTLALPSGLTLQAGRFYSELGYLNNQHPHSWSFVDAALPYRALLGNQYGDDGIQLRWLAETELFFELGAELFRGDRYPAGGGANNGSGVHNLFMTVGGDVGSSHSWQAGLSYLQGKADARSTDGGSTEFNGDVEVAALDLVWKWAPHGNPRQRNFVFQTEYLQRKESGTYTLSGIPDVINSKQSGWYVQGVYQFMPRWRVGLRHDQLSIDDPGSAFDATVLDPAGHTPKRNSIMLDFANSEFSRIRLQYNQDDSGSEPDHQWYLQYVMSLGAHGAHRF